MSHSRSRTGNAHPSLPLTISRIDEGVSIERDQSRQRGRRQRGRTYDQVFARVNPTRDENLGSGEPRDVSLVKNHDSVEVGRRQDHGLEGIGQWNTPQRVVLKVQGKKIRLSPDEKSAALAGESNRSALVRKRSHHAPVRGDQSELAAQLLGSEAAPPAPPGSGLI